MDVQSVLMLNVEHWSIQFLSACYNGRESKSSHAAKSVVLPERLGRATNYVSLYIVSLSLSSQHWGNYARSRCCSKMELRKLVVNFIVQTKKQEQNFLKLYCKLVTFATAIMASQNMSAEDIMVEDTFYSDLGGAGQYHRRNETVSLHQWMG